MASSTLFLNETLYGYMRDLSLREPELMQRLRKETAELEMAVMQITPEQGQFMTLVTQMMGAARVIEVGTFTGYSTLALAQGVVDGGHVVACDINDQWTSMARRYWREADMDGRIELHLAPALKTLQKMLDDGESGSYDLMFIDADKENYGNYFELGLKLLRSGGVVMVDNVFWGGSVADESNQESETAAIRAFNKALVDDDRVDISMVPIGDGLTLARKR